MKSIVAACLLFLFATKRVHCSNGALLTTELNPPLATPGAVVTFTCTISNSSILEWLNPEYIGAEVLQILSHTGARSTVASISNPSTTATRLNFTDGHVPTIISELRLIASAQYPLSSVTCRNNALKSNVTITLHTLESYITLTSEGVTASSGEQKVLNCTTIGSSIMAWYSEEYIGVNDLQILSHNRSATVVPSVNNPSTIATRLSSTVENGLPIIVSQLRIVVSSQYQTASVTCRNVATGANRTIEIRISDSRHNNTIPATQNYATSTDHDTEPTSAVSGSHVVIVGATVAVIIFSVTILLVALAIVIQCFVHGKNQKVSTDEKQSEEHPFDHEIESLKERVDGDEPRSPESSSSESSRNSADSAAILIDDPNLPMKPLEA